MPAAYNTRSFLPEFVAKPYMKPYIFMDLRWNRKIYPGPGECDNCGQHHRHRALVKLLHKGAVFSSPYNALWTEVFGIDGDPFVSQYEKREHFPPSPNQAKPERFRLYNCPIDYIRFGLIVHPVTFRKGINGLKIEMPA